jgi:hypothetical protein
MTILYQEPRRWGVRVPSGSYEMGSDTCSLHFRPYGHGDYFESPTPPPGPSIPLANCRLQSNLPSDSDGIPTPGELRLPETMEDPHLIGLMQGATIQTG